MTVAAEPHGEMVSVKRLARILDMDRSSALRYIKRCGFEPSQRRTADSSGQLASTLTKEEANAILERRRSEGFVLGGKSASPGEHGNLYIILLAPDLDANRVKLGFAQDVRDRLAQHRTAAPTAEVLKCWPCRRSWESAAIASMSREGCRTLSNEAFDCDNVDDLVARGEQFFAMMPALSRE